MFFAGMSNGTTRNRTDLVIVGSVWAVVTALTFWAVSVANLHPIGASTNAEISDEAFDILMYLATPIVTFVLVVLIYSLVRFRSKPSDDDYGPPVRSNTWFVAAWVVISVVLSVYVIFNPGFSGLDALAADTDEDMTIEVVAEQWSWDYTYIDEGLEIVDADDLVLPIDTLILFKITSRDVIHSFWVPAFRIKMDAVPGLITEIYMTATELGEFAEEDGFRVQCAELCGTGHTRMRNTVTVLSQDDYATWVAETKDAQAQG